ncbi:kinase-like domain-containing protein [Mycena olivaceomarginata]|nr:kinase-like domain-containing protein [Mycena olivaceomarginata]
MSLRNPPPPSGSSRTRSVAVGAAAPRREPQQRVSHQMPPPHVAPINEAPLPDVFAHPAVIAYGANHPNRPLPKFGSYYLLHTLGEGEFGKVKLGLHSKYGDEVAVKLIRRDAVVNEAKMAKISREIEILDMLRHPNIVRLYDVFETDKFFGIILEYASGGELFDHILAHRCLKERDAAKLFAQLISGVWYMHQQNIVHRDLKLENLLLDRHRNLVITDFGFANRFDHDRNDLMETMCGSPCYAAPELVNQNGLYVGTAADIWSCGVILYAMLSGYLPFDDDPTNPDGEDINKLYAYIARTPLSFPDQLSDEARHLLSAMLVADPRARAELGTIMRHPWFAMNLREMTTFGLTVKELEKLAEDGRPLAYRRTARNGISTPLTPRKGARNRNKRIEVSDASEERTVGSPLKDAVGSPRKQRGAGRVSEDKGKERERDHGRKEENSRHTIQVEYDGRRGARDGQQQERQSSSQGPSDSRKTPVMSTSPLAVVHDGSESAFGGQGVETSPGKERRRRVSRSSGKSSPSARAVVSVSPVQSWLESAAENPPSTDYAEINGVDGSLRGAPQFDPSSIHLDRPPIPFTDTPRGTLTKTEAKAQLPPLIIDASSSSSSAKQPLTPTTHPNASDIGAQASPSPSKPNKVMQWFRKGRRSVAVSGGLSPSPFSPAKHEAAASSVEVASIPHKQTPPPPPQSPFLVTPGTVEHRKRTTSAVSITSLFRRSAGVSNNKAAMRVHHGAVDNEMITAGPATRADAACARSALCNGRRNICRGRV